MYLKTEKELYHTRRRRYWRRWLIVLSLIVGLALLSGAGYWIYTVWEQSPEGQIAALNTPTPQPTPTRELESYVAEAEAAYLDGRLVASIEAYQHALNIEPNQAELYIILARLLIFQGQPARGLHMAREAIRRQPESARAWAVKCMAYDWLGMPQTAVEACQTALDFDDQLPEAHAYLAEAYVDMGNWWDANTTIAHALDLEEDNVDVQRNYGWVLEMQGNYSGAIEAYQRALEIHPNLIHLYVAIARNAQALGNYSQAVRNYEVAAKIDVQNPAPFDSLGWAYLLQGEYDQAQENLERAVEIDDRFFRAYGHLGTLYFQNRNYEDAIEAFKPAIRYSEAASRRNVVFFILTLEEAGEVGAAPNGEEVARGEFIHPIDIESPLRARVQGRVFGSDLEGWIRLDVMGGRYVVRLSGLPPHPEGQHYLGWFLPMRTPELALVHTDPIAPSPTGNVEVTGETEAVKGAPIEQYYTLSLCYYFLDQCDLAQPYIRVALRIDPNDANAQQAQRLCSNGS